VSIGKFFSFLVVVDRKRKAADAKKTLKKGQKKGKTEPIELITIDD
jgi:hypothetical protein